MITVLEEKKLLLNSTDLAFVVDENKVDKFINLRTNESTLKRIREKANKMKARTIKDETNSSK